MAPSMAVEPQTAPDTGKTSLRQRLLLHGVSSGLSVSEAGEAAGYPSRQNAHDAYRRLRDRLPELMDGEGLGIRQTLKRLKAKMDATKLELASYRGTITDMVEVDDNPTQLKAIETVLTLMGLTGRDNGNTSIGTVNIHWNGAAPGWANRPTPDATVSQCVLDSTVVSSGNSNATVEGDGLSAIEGTGNGTGAPTQAHSGKLVERCSRVVKKRKPRLPVYKGDK